jgi:hypothetical protein
MRIEQIKFFFYLFTGGGLIVKEMFYEENHF